MFITLEEFKQAVSEFLKEVNTLNLRQLWAAYSAIGSAYLKVEDSPLNTIMAPPVLLLASKAYFEREYALTKGES